MKNTIKNSLEEARIALERLLADGETLGTIAAAAAALTESLENGGRVFACGNGGSMCDAMHFCEEWTGRFRGDRRRIGQILLNLADNALKYAPSGSRVLIRGSRREAGLRIEVVDSGPGIPPEHRERLFERFYRVDGARSGRGKSVIS